MDNRTARRAAERAARDLINSRAALVGELGVAAAERLQLSDEVNAAAGRGRQLVEAAEVEAARLLAGAHDLVMTGEQRYTDVYTAATAAGWAPADLTALGFASPGTATRQRRQARTAPPARTDVDAPVAVPTQPHPVP